MLANQTCSLRAAGYSKPMQDAFIRLREQTNFIPVWIIGLDNQATGETPMRAYDQAGKCMCYNGTKMDAYKFGDLNGPSCAELVAQCKTIYDLDGAGYTYRENILIVTVAALYTEILRITSEYVAYEQRDSTTFDANVAIARVREIKHTIATLAAQTAALKLECEGLIVRLRAEVDDL